MTIREIINKLEAEKNQYKEENELLKVENKELVSINKKLVDELNSYKDKVVKEVIKNDDEPISDWINDVDVRIEASKPKKSKKKKEVEPIEEN